MDSFYTYEELLELGFQYVGKEVKISRKASIYGASGMSIGDYSRIDDFCILSGKITIGKYVHISAYTALYGGSAGITFDDYSGISARGNVYAMSDDFGGDYLSNSTLPDELRHVISNPVTVGKYCQIGAGCTLLPGASLEDGSALAAMSLCKKPLEGWMIYGGVPCKPISERKQNLLKLVESFEKTDV